MLKEKNKNKEIVKEVGMGGWGPCKVGGPGDDVAGVVEVEGPHRALALLVGET